MEEHPEVPFSYGVVLYMDASGGVPDANDAESYWEDIGEPEFPVTGSVNEDIKTVLGYDWAAAPTAGNVVLSPDMEILAVQGGHGEHDWAYDTILDHMAQE